MTHPQAYPDLAQQGGDRFAATPLVRRDDQWWFVAQSGAVRATDPVLLSELDQFARDMAAADHAVVALRDESRAEPSVVRP